ncbi:MAG TPA: exo-alpha-sialidase, partial [Arenibacter sp.]|nr:exo-alpha-sialidase [Arenibacter sp.]
MIYSNRLKNRCLLILLLIFWVSPLFSQAPKEKQESLEALNFVFEGGNEDYKCFRIPAVVTTNNGTLLAFAEGRKNGCSDTGDIDLVMKRSTDGGKTWGKLGVIWHDEGNTCGNPSPVVDRVTGNIFLLSTWNLGTDHES